MDANEAREHLEMVDRILSQAEVKPVQIVPGLIIVWGIAAAAIDVGQQMLMSHIAGKSGLWLSWGAILAGIVYSAGVCISLARNHCLERVSIAEERIGRAMGAVWFTVFVAAFAQPHVFAGWGGAAVWSMGAAIMMLMSGFSGEKRSLIGGLILLASVLAANYVFPQTPGYVLAAGFLLGYAAPGISFLSKPPRGDA